MATANGLKLKLSTKLSGIAPSTSTPPTPIVTPGGTTKLKLKLGPKSNPSSPAPPPPSTAPKIKTTKAGRSSKPSAKVIESQSRKRTKDDRDSDDEGTIQVQQPAPKKIKLNVATGSGGGGPLSAAPKTPGGVIIKAKIKGKPPARPLGEGYDSEASDREVDPAIEEQFILRMIPGESCDYLREAAALKRIGLPRNQGGPDIQLKFFDGDGRRGLIRIQEKMFAATLVDLPTIIEGMKSWDRRGWWKSADICQMMLIFAEIKKEEDAKTIELPAGIDPVTFQYPHGLTAPMHYARKRVFRKRISKKAIEQVEKEVEKLLQADAAAHSTRFDMIDPDRREASSPEGSEEPEDDEDIYSGNEDAEGEDDDQEGYFDQHTIGRMEEISNADAIAAELEAEMMAEFEAGTPASTLDAPSMATGETPILQEEEADEDGEEYDSGDESVEEGDDAGLSALPEIDAEEKNRQKQLDGTREDIQELERQLAQQQHNLGLQGNLLLKRRIEDSIRKIKNELQLKKSSIGEGDDEDA